MRGGALSLRERKAAAREALRARLADAQAYSFLGDSRCAAELKVVFRRGFKGFDRMNDTELVQCAFDAGLGREEEVLELMSMLCPRIMSAVLRQPRTRAG